MRIPRFPKKTKKNKQTNKQTKPSDRRGNASRCASPDYVVYVVQRCIRDPSVLLAYVGHRGSALQRSEAGLCTPPPRQRVSHQYPTKASTRPDGPALRGARHTRACSRWPEHERIPGMYTAGELHFCYVWYTRPKLERDLYSIAVRDPTDSNTELHSSHPATPAVIYRPYHIIQITQIRPIRYISAR